MYTCIYTHTYAYTYSYIYIYIYIYIYLAIAGRYRLAAARGAAPPVRWRRDRSQPGPGASCPGIVV